MLRNNLEERSPQNMLPLERPMDEYYIGKVYCLFKKKYTERINAMYDKRAVVLLINLTVYMLITRLLWNMW